MSPLPTPPPSWNVLAVNYEQGGGGAGRVSEALSAGLRERGHDVRAFVARNRAHDCGAQPAGHWRGQQFARFLADLGLPNLGDLSTCLWRYRPAFAQADVLHLHILHGNYLSLAGLPLWGRDKPIIWTLHDFWGLTGNCATPRDCRRWQAACGQCPLLGVYPLSQHDRTRLYRRLKPWLLAKARPRLVTPSRWLAGKVREHPQLRRWPLRVIPNPVNCRQFTPCANPAALRRSLGLTAECFTVALTGANWRDPFKGGADAVAALRQAVAALRELQVLVVGSGSDALLAATGLRGRTWTFMADRRRLAEVYAAADVCLFPSRAENYPMTVLESLACGTPVVAYAVGGVPEQIEDGRSGLVVPDGDVQGLAMALVRLGRDAPSCRRMGAAGRDFVSQTCDLPVVVREYEDEYRRAWEEWCRYHGRFTARRDRGALARRVCAWMGWSEDQAGAAGPLPRPDPQAAREKR